LNNLKLATKALRNNQGTEKIVEEIYEEEASIAQEYSIVDSETDLNFTTDER